MLAQEHADQFSHADLLLIDRTNPMDDSNSLALVEHAIGHTDGRDGSSIRVKFFFDQDAKAGQPAEIKRVQSMTKTLLQPMSRWCEAHVHAAHVPCFVCRCTVGCACLHVRQQGVVHAGGCCGSATSRRCPASGRR